MAWDLYSDRPIYAQLVEILKRQIIAGIYPPGARLPSVRDLAEAAAVNPNTMQRAYAELERSGLVQTQRTNGRTVTEDRELIERFRLALAREQVEGFLKKMQDLGYTKQQIRDLIDETFKAKEGDYE